MFAKPKFFNTDKMVKVKVVTAPGELSKYLEWLNEQALFPFEATENGAIFEVEDDYREKNKLAEFLLGSFKAAGVRGNLLLPRDQLPGPESKH